MPQHPPTRRLRRALAGVAAAATATLGLVGLTGSASAITTTTGAIDHSSAGCTTSTLPANDDGSTGVQDLGFSINFLGTTYSQLYVNNNGNVTFNGSLGTYTPFSLLSTSTPIIAPFFADVDTAVPGSDQVTYGQVPNWQNTGHKAFCVDWDGVTGVAYYATGNDKFNKFQLILVDRSDRGAGDFDIIFNYDQIQWETGSASGGSGGLGGNSARAGYSNGSNFNFELPGSAVNGAFLDSNPTGLIHRSNVTMPDGSPFNGRFVFPVQNGLPPGTASISGRVFDANTPANGVPSRISACFTDMTSCPGGGQTGSDGSYVLTGLPPGNYIVRANPSDTNFTPGQYNGTAYSTTPGVVTLTNSQTASGVDIGVTGPTPPPPGVVVGGDGFRGTTDQGGNLVPIVYWQQPITLSTVGCPGGTGSYVVSDDNGPFANGPMTDTGVRSTLNGLTNQDVFTAAVPAFYPHHGNVTVTMTVTNCPSGSPGTPTDNGFSMYIDPSGVVSDQNGHPINGATVTLFRSDTGDTGTFGQVANGSDLMDASNRANPSTTDSNGHYGWNVQPGFYYVTATALNCDTATSPVFQIPPAVTDANLTLHCTSPTGDTTPPSCQVVATRTVNGVKMIDVKVTDAGTGLAVVSSVRLVNATWQYAPLSYHVFSPAVNSVTLTFSKVNQSQGSVIGFDMRDVAGNVARC